MCGIVGYTGAQQKDKLEFMMNSIIHRGPDEDGVFENSDFHLGMRRLSILDVSGGKQPIYSQNLKCLLLYNGEIYNYLELRNLLEDNYSYQFKTNTDTEVIANLYEVFGLDFLNKLEGMYAIALLDLQDNALYLIRDRYGKKPIYYFTNPDQTYLEFSSEFKTLKKSNPVNWDVDSLIWYFAQKTCPNNSSIDKSIKKLQPGTYLKFKIGEPIKFQTFYKSTFSIKISDNEEKALKILENKLSESVKIRMRADVEVGTFLSGGIDSSLITFFASQHTPKRLKTYCLVYDEPIANKKSDQHYSQTVSKMINSDHQEVLLTPELFLQELPKIISHFREPNAATISMWFIAMEMKKSIKVALSGDGADELFGSYFYPRALHWIENYKNHSSSFNINDLRDYEKEFVLNNKDLNFLELTDLFSVFGSKDLQLLFSNSHQKAASLYLELLSRNTFSSIKEPSLFIKALDFDWNNLLVNQVLNYSDLLAMAHSIEVRCPFMDSRLVEYISNLNTDLKIRGNETKYLLKKLAQRYLPNDLIYRPKEGFVEPSIAWLKTHLRATLEEYIYSKDFNKLGYLNKNYAQNLVTHFLRDSSYNEARKVWSLLVYSIWEEIISNEQS